MLFFVEDVDYYARRIDSVITLYYRMEDDEIIGIEVKGVTHLLKLLGDFGVEYDGENVRFTLIFCAYFMQRGLANEPCTDNVRSFLENDRLSQARFNTAELAEA